MNSAYIRPGGVAQDIPEGGVDKIAETLPLLRKRLKDTANLLIDNNIWMGRTVEIGFLDLTGCMALGVTGPILRATGLPHDLRKSQPYCGYETYDFEVVTETTCDAYGRFLIRVREMHQSMHIVEQCIERLRASTGDPVMVADKKIAWPAQLSVGSDGQGNSVEHIKEIMSESMEALIHHFKLVTEGFRVPAGQAYASIESPRGELGCHLVSAGGTRPYRIHFRDPSFTNLQATAAMSEGGQIADVIAAVASIDPVMGGVDR
jgi:NADH-quinone oxidoreductase subunit D